MERKQKDEIVKEASQMSARMSNEVLPTIQVTIEVGGKKVETLTCAILDQVCFL